MTTIKCINMCVQVYQSSRYNFFLFSGPNHHSENFLNRLYLPVREILTGPMVFLQALAVGPIVNREDWYTTSDINIGNPCR